MKRLLLYGFVFCLGILFTEAIGRLTVNELLAAQPPQVATATFTPQNPPDDIRCFVGDVLYVLPRWTPIFIPTRLPTVTPLPETVTPTLRPSATATPTVGACRAYVVKASVLNIRSQPDKSAKIIKTLKLNDTVSLSTLPQDSVTDTEGTVWRKLCAEASYLSQNWVSVK